MPSKPSKSAAKPAPKKPGNTRGQPNSPKKAPANKAVAKKAAPARKAAKPAPPTDQSSALDW